MPFYPMQLSNYWQGLNNQKILNSLFSSFLGCLLLLRSVLVNFPLQTSESNSNPKVSAKLSQFFHQFFATRKQHWTYCIDLIKFLQSSKHPESFLLSLWPLHPHPNLVQISFPGEISIAVISFFQKRTILSGLTRPSEKQGREQQLYNPADTYKSRGKIAGGRKH